MKTFAKNVFKGEDPHIIGWDRPTVREFCKKRVQGRPTKGYGIAEFNYAGKLYNPEPWTPSVEYIKNKAEEWASKLLDRPIEFTFCLCGLYGTGDVAIPHHSDTVPTLDDIVLGISFGGTRLLEWNEYGREIKEESNTSETLDFITKWTPVTRKYLLEDGDVYMFDGRSQMTSTHSIPSIEFGAKRRVSLTFRTGL
tara:strand:+ start:1166 stop:1753 length:588 start_codon:yes stop_codon:yes gene_type:complete